jgi:hypothetical protein
MRKTNEQPLKEVLKELIDAYRIHDRLCEARILGAWERLMGPTVSRRTREIYISNHVLHLQVSSAPLREELALSRAKILEKLNEVAGCEFLKDLVVR